MFTCYLWCGVRVFASVPGRFFNTCVYSLGGSLAAVCDRICSTSRWVTCGRVLDALASFLPCLVLSSVCVYFGVPKPRGRYV